MTEFRERTRKKNSDNSYQCHYNLSLCRSECDWNYKIELDLNSLCKEDETSVKKLPKRTMCFLNINEKFI